MSAITTFDEGTTERLRTALVEQHARLAQLDKAYGQRSITAKNYDSSIRALGNYMADQDAALPSRSVLEQWRDDMADGELLSGRGEPFAPRTINARLSAVRKLLRGVAADAVDIHIKLVLEDWARVSDVKGVSIQDYVEGDHGIRLSRQSLTDYINSPDANTLMGLRDRALLVLMGCAGLRVSEAVRVLVGDVGVSSEGSDLLGIRVVGKFNKQRVVVLGNEDNVVLRAVRAFVGRLPLGADDPVIWAFRRLRGGGHTVSRPLSERRAQQIAASYLARHDGEMISIGCHDLRRTYAKLSHDAGMEWDALSLNMGHASIKTTEEYVGRQVNWSKRVPAWTVEML